jgi:glycosyltransferase involved in cell wall biosynthesis
MQETHGPARWLGRCLPRSITRKWWPTFVRLDQSKSTAELHRIMRCIRTSLDAVIAPSPILADRFRAFGTPEERITEILYGVAPEKIVRPKKALSERMRFAYMGSAEPVKGLYVVIEALDPLPDDLPMEITAFGNEQVKEAIEDGSPRAKRYLAYHKPLFGAALANEHARIDAVLVPSLWHENSPFVVLESLANGTPVIASDQAGILDLILPDHTGWLIEAGRAAAWTRAFVRAIERPAVIRSMQRNAKFDRKTSDFVNDVEQLEQQFCGQTAATRAS